MDKISEELDDIADQNDTHGNIGTRSKTGNKRGYYPRYFLGKLNKLQQVKRLSSLAATNSRKKLKCK